MNDSSANDIVSKLQKAIALFEKQTGESPTEITLSYADAYYIHDSLCARSGSPERGEKLFGAVVNTSGGLLKGSFHLRSKLNHGAYVRSQLWVNGQFCDMSSPKSPTVNKPEYDRFMPRYWYGHGGKDE